MFYNGRKIEPTLIHRIDLRNTQLRFTCKWQFEFCRKWISRNRFSTSVCYSVIWWPLSFSLSWSIYNEIAPFYRPKGWEMLQCESMMLRLVTRETSGSFVTSILGFLDHEKQTSWSCRTFSLSRNGFHTYKWFVVAENYSLVHVGSYKFILCDTIEKIYTVYLIKCIQQLRKSWVVYRGPDEMRSSGQIWRNPSAKWTETIIFLRKRTIYSDHSWLFRWLFLLSYINMVLPTKMKRT